MHPHDFSCFSPCPGPPWSHSSWSRTCGGHTQGEWNPGTLPWKGAGSCSFNHCIIWNSTLSQLREVNRAVVWIWMGRANILSQEQEMDKDRSWLESWFCRRKWWRRVVWAKSVCSCGKWTGWEFGWAVSEHCHRWRKWTRTGVVWKDNWLLAGTSW